MVSTSIARVLLKQWLRYGLDKKHGGWRVAQKLAKGQSSAPVRTGNLAPVYLDLSGFDLLEISLFLASPAEAEFEREDRNAFRKLVKPGDVVFDIGANIGYHLSLFASLVGESGMVYGFEPQPVLLPNLRLTAGGIANAKLIECALSDREGELILHAPEHGYHMLAAIADPGVKSTEIRCQSATLDRLWSEQQIPLPDFIKIDVEGAETLVLRGAKELLNREDAPIVFFEQWQEAAERSGFRGTEAADVLLSLERPGFTLFELVDGKLRSLAANTVSKGNLIAGPKSKLSRVA